MKKTGVEEKGITRGEFLKGTAGLMLALGSGITLKGLAETFAPEEAPVGPQLREELEIVKTAGGAKAVYDGQTCFTVNEEGLRLLRLADGRHTLDEIIRKGGMAGKVDSVFDFFQMLGDAGYLTAILEVNRIDVCYDC